MSSQEEDSEREPKRQRLDDEGSSSPNLQSLRRAISPPPRSTRANKPFKTAKISLSEQSQAKETIQPSKHALNSTAPPRSPFRLTRIADLPDEANTGAVSLEDILGNGALTEVWLFDFLFDVDFVMSKFPAGIRDAVQVCVVHGSWRRDSEQRLHLDAAEKRYRNVRCRCAYMPDRFGTHHSKMMVLFAGEEACQVIVHTANMIPFDWENMTQGLWLSPWLIKAEEEDDEETQEDAGKDAIGSGSRFKTDLMAYLKKYEGRTKDLVSILQPYDFSPIRAAFLASAPGSVPADPGHPSSTVTQFGWPGLGQILSSIPRSTSSSPTSDVLVAQISSIATLSEKWADNFFTVLLTDSHTGPRPSSPSRLRRLVRVVFPTVDEIRRSLSGWESGGSIHLKGASPAQKKQLAWLGPMFCRWGGPDSGPDDEAKDALRARAAPHIKTFVRYAEGCEGIEWALLTSANLSTQAWGGLPGADGSVRIASYETGVLVWPEVLVGGSGGKMVPVFGRDEAVDGTGNVVPLRMAYSLPLHGYEKKDRPWCKVEAHEEKDRHGRGWSGG